MQRLLPPPRNLALLLLSAALFRLVLQVLRLVTRRAHRRHSARSVEQYASQALKQSEKFQALMDTLLAIIGKDVVRRREIDAENAAGAARGIGDEEGEFFGSPHRERSNRNSLYSHSVEALSSAVCEAAFTVDDLLRPNAEKLFWIHKVVAPYVSGGMGVRFTVQLNLFAGSIANLGNDAQRAQLQTILTAGELGCFALTEAGAGVLSGLIVGTTATYCKETGGFVIHSPHADSRKWWISQGTTAKWAVVIARLLLPPEVNAGKTDFGPHAFLVNLHQSAISAVSGQDPSDSGVVIEDMEPKTDFNDLDNATMTFHHLVVRNESLLSGVSFVMPATGQYQLRDQKVPFQFEVVAQRLLSGRICIPLAASSLVEAYELKMKGYHRLIPTGKDVTRELSDMPFLRDSLLRSARVRHVFAVYIQHVMDQFVASPPNFMPSLVEKIAVAKILVLDFAIRQIAEFKRLVGSYSLMSHGPFGTAPDLLYVFQFAEGDSSILKQKIARDLLTRASSSVLETLKVLNPIILPASSIGARLRKNFAITTARLLSEMRQAGRGQAKVNAWLEAHETVNKLATLRCLVLVREVVLKEDPSLEGSLELEAFDQFFKPDAAL